MRKFTSVFALILISLALFTAQSLGVVSPPNWVNFQGFLTDNTGAPVADGTYDVDFNIYNVPAGGVPVWTEVTTQTTSNGRFTHLLGSVTPFFTSFFAAYDSLYLEMVVEGEIISPRTPLTSAPYSKVADGLEMQGVFTNPGVAAIDTDPGDYWVNVYSDDGNLRSRLGYFSEGVLELIDGNDLVQIGLYSGSSGDPSVQFPNNAISDLEILDEPGVASDTSNPNAFDSLFGGIQVLNTRSITSPDGTGTGYILAIVTANVIVSHTNGTLSNAELALSESSTSYTNVQDQDIQVPATAATGSYQFPITIHGLFDIPQNVTSSYYFLGQLTTGSVSVGDVNFTLIYFSTNRGAVEPLAAGTLAGSDGGSHATGMPLSAADIAAERAGAEALHAAQIARELEEVRTIQAQAAARLEKLERRVSQQESVNPQK